jgi:predicted amidohydrolase YtcJ
MVADTIVLGGRIRARASAETHSHLALRAGRVSALGGREVLAWRGPSTEVIDLQGGTLLPGFHDAHTHVVYEAIMLTGLNVGAEHVRSLADLVAMVRTRAAAQPPGTWLTGSGWTEHAFSEGRVPHRLDLDQAAPDHLVVLDRLDGHLRAVNSAALRRAGITRATLDPPGGRIDRDATGEPTGILRDTAMRLVAEHMPPAPLAARKAGIRQVLEAALRRGVTSVTAAVGRAFTDDVRAYADLYSEDALPTRVTMMLGRDHLEEALACGLRSGFGDHWLRFGPLKVFVDGNFPAGTARLSGLGGSGLWRTPPDELRALVAQAQAAGWAVAMHAIGDAAVGAALDAVEAAQAGAPSVLPHRVEHGSLCPPLEVARAARLGVAFCVQPGVLHVSNRKLLAALTPVQRRSLLPYASLHRAGVTLAFSSDAPFTRSADPLVAVAAAVCRRNADGDPVGASEALSLETAWQAATWGGAVAARESAWKGTLEVGQVGDFVAYGQDPWRLDPASLPGLPPLLVGVGGRVRYRGDASA